MSRGNPYYGSTGATLQKRLHRGTEEAALVRAGGKGEETLPHPWGRLGLVVAVQVPGAWM